MTANPKAPFRAIFVNRFYYPDHSASAQMLTDVAAGLAAKGWEVTVITSRLSYDDPALTYPPRSEEAGVRIIRVATTRFGRAGLLGRAADYASFYAASFFSLLRHARRGSVVVMKTDPPLLSVPLGLAARLKGARRVNWLQDIFPEAAAELGLGLARGPIGAFVKVLRNLSLRRADRTVVIGPRMEKRVTGMGVSRAKITEIQNFCDEEAIVPVEPSENPLRAAWGFGPDDFVVGYSGNLGRAHDLGTFLGAAERLRGETGIRFLFIGGGHLRRELEAEATARGLTSIITKPYQPREQLAFSLSAPDVHWLSLRPELEGLILPSKFYGIAAAGRPMIMVGDTEGDISLWATTHQFGYAVPIDAPDAFAKAVLQLRLDKVRTQNMGRNARTFLESRARRADIIERWSETLHRVRRGKRTGPL
jgi:glycosyltransferase involved in cell wall biosynthesis